MGARPAWPQRGSLRVPRRSRWYAGSRGCGANDPSVQFTRKDGDALIASSNDLKLCADLANGSKHFSLTQTRTGDLGTDIKRNDATVFVGTGTTAHRFYIQSNGVEHDVLDVAEAAVAAWDAFLSQKGLLPARTP